jgi:Thiolase, C-terminal domain
MARDGEGPARLLSAGFVRADKAQMSIASTRVAQVAMKEAGLSFDRLKCVVGHNPFTVNDVWFAKRTGYALAKMNVFGCSLIYGRPARSTAGLRSPASGRNPRAENRDSAGSGGCRPRVLASCRHPVAHHRPCHPGKKMNRSSDASALRKAATKFSSIAAFLGCVAVSQPDPTGEPPVTTVKPRATAPSRTRVRVALLYRTTRSLGARPGPLVLREDTYRKARLIHRLTERYCSGVRTHCLSVKRTKT